MNALMSSLKEIAQQNHLTVLGDKLVPLEAVEKFADAFADWEVMPPGHIKMPASVEEARGMILLAENYLQARHVKN